MVAENRLKGPWIHRFLVGLFTIVLGVLIYWLLGFVLEDIGALPGPDYTQLEKERLGTQIWTEEQTLTERLTDVGRRITDKQEQQQLLRDSTDSSQRTMNQLLEIQRLALEKDVKPAAEEQQSLAESEQLFLDNQQHYQKLNEELVGLNAERRQLQKQQEELQERMRKLREPIMEEYSELLRRHALRVAAYKLAFLLPLLFIAGGLFFKLREKPYGRLVFAFGGAVLVQVVQVMHEYFPALYFKYIVIVAAILVVLRILVYLLQMISRPKRDWLLKQFREAYEVFLCPVCSFPIRRGPLRYHFWTRQSIKKLTIPAITGNQSEEPYICPLCATQLYEPCSECKAIRLSLLPACEHCGASKPLETLPV